MLRLRSLLSSADLHYRLVLIIFRFSLLLKFDFGCIHTKFSKIKYLAYYLFIICKRYVRDILDELKIQNLFPKFAQYLPDKLDNTIGKHVFRPSFEL